jgi:hypothetical protein
LIAKTAGCFVRDRQNPLVFFFRWQNPLASLEITNFRWSCFAIDAESAGRFVRGCEFPLVLFALDVEIRRSLCSRTQKFAGPHALDRKIWWPLCSRSQISNGPFFSSGIWNKTIVCLNFDEFLLYLA